MSPAKKRNEFDRDTAIGFAVNFCAMFSLIFTIRSFGGGRHCRRQIKRRGIVVARGEASRLFLSGSGRVFGRALGAGGIVPGFRPTAGGNRARNQR